MLLITLSILLSLFYYYMGFFAFFIRKDVQTNRIFLLLTVLFSAWSLSGSLFNLINIPEVSSIWILMSYVIWTVGTALILHFCLLLRSDEGHLKRKSLALIYGPALVMLGGMIVFSGLTPTNQIASDPMGILFGIPGGIALYVIYMIISIWKLAAMGRKSEDFRVRKQGQLISWALIVSTVLVGIYGFVLPGMVEKPLPVLLPFFPCIWIVSMWISITKYGFLTVTMEIATKEILDNIQEIIILTDNNCMILDVNKKFEELIKMKKEEINGRMLKEILYSNQTVINHIEQVLQKKEATYSGDVDFHLDSGQSIPIRIRISSIVDHLDHVIGVIVAANDLTLEKKYELLSITDSLTGAYNRMKIERVIERLLQARDHFSVIIFDMDHFKKINDEFGHPAGDHVLIHTVALLNRELRAIDFIGRWGGEEFIIVIPGANESTAYQVSERIRTAVAEYDFELGRAVTISLGIAEFTGAGKSLGELVNQADEALYAAKHGGRNKTVTYSSL